MGARSGDGRSITFPDVCKTPAGPAGPIPTPYPHIDQLGQASVETKKVKIAARRVLSNRAQYRLESGDEAGALKGLTSMKATGKAQYQAWSMNVKAEGKNVLPLTMVGLQNSRVKKGASMQMAAPASTTVTLDDIDESLAEHKKKIANPGAYQYEDAKKVQAEFEHKLEGLLSRLTMSPQATPELQVLVNDLAVTVMAAAKGK